ncbi:hypothetical protein JHK87_045058 [Glycine soja]|nr:hypothetical protein JHK87_045058 [Glycine soja]
MLLIGTTEVNPQEEGTTLDELIGKLQWSISSFSVSAKELMGYQGNCIYFMDIFDVHVYNLDYCSIVSIDFDPCMDKSMCSHSSWLRIGQN